MSESVEALAAKIRSACAGAGELGEVRGRAALDALREKLYMEGHAQGFEDGTEAAAADVRAAEADRGRYKNALERIAEDIGDDVSVGELALRRIARDALNPEQRR